MSSKRPEILDLFPKQQMKDFLSTMAQDDRQALSVWNAEGQRVMDGIASQAPAEQARLVREGPEVKQLVSQLLSAGSSSTIKQAPGLPLYGAPLSFQGNVLGVLIGGFPKEQDPAVSSRHFQRIWLHFQDCLIHGYELDNLSAEIVRNYEELALLYNLSIRLSAQSDLDRISQIVLEEIKTHLPASHYAFMVVDEADGSVLTQLVLDKDGFRRPPFRLKSGQGITGQVIATGNPMIVCDVSRDAAFTEVTYPINSLLSVPITMGSKVLGAINVSDKAQGEEFTSYDLKLISTIASQAAVALSNARLFGELKDLFLSTVKSLVMAIDAKDPYTHSHSLRVSQLSTAVAEVLGLEKPMVEDIKLAALLHDIGKIGVPEKVLYKPDKLDHHEWEEMKQHPLHSVRIIEQVKQFEHLAKWVRHEHERYDGKGYPDGLKGEKIPLASRIIAVADAFDAITSDRYYRKGRPEPEALEVLKAHAGTQFDPKIVDAFVTAHQKGRLQSLPAS
jgi:putative nucleotidyltransferase with HDIG domain